LLVAKYEAEALLKALVRRASRLEFLGAEPPSYKRINTLRTMRALPLRVSA